ncbi:hypothetical protein [Candidatus Uabimicrobium sp. HlEnr_7]|uniref:hypothetical protein n=1 Tax=Candidatus Uabimicrobium helgolandensis TaxID=3095367 RepID=UPI0035576802
MTTALVSMLYFSGNFEKGRNFLAEHGYIKKMLSKSRFNRRIRAIGESVWLSLFHLFAEISKRNNLRDYIIDSFPIPVCDNIRISRCKIYTRSSELCCKQTLLFFRFAGSYARHQNWFTS